MIETWLNLFGLLLTRLGAFVAARSVIISKEQAKSLSGTYWNGNEALRDTLLARHLIADRRSDVFPDRGSDLSRSRAVADALES